MGLDTKEQLRKTSNKESMGEVLKIWTEIDKINGALSVSFDEYPYEMPRLLYHQHKNILKSLLNDKMEELEFIEKMIDAQNTKYKPLDFVNN